MKKNRKEVEGRESQAERDYIVQKGIEEDNFYGNIDPRRRQEMHDAYMVREDQNAMANLPRQAIHHEFNVDKFKYNSVSAGSPDWSHNEIGFIRKAQKGFYEGSE
jgi:hypothetical protein